MRIVVTGALGHIGSHLIRRLPERFPGSEIVMLDNMATQRFPSLFDLPSQAHFTFHECDVTTPDFARHVAGAEIVIHLAALTDATSSFERRSQVETINFEASKQVAAACLQHNAAMIGVSSTSVYGTQKNVVDEECGPEDLKPQSPYAETKLREERLLAEMAQKGLRVAILRLGTIFGVSPGMRFHTAINKFCWQAVMGTPLTVWRTAYEQRRPYLDLIDASEAMSLFIARRQFDGRIYNVVTENATVRDVVERIRKVVPAVTVNFVDETIMNQLSYDVSDARLRGLGFRPMGSMERGIAETVALLRRANAG
jgi:nucleoside-diphosphate-sugar epimerase